VGGELVRVADGRTPWQVFRDERFIGNSRIDPCSKILKRKQIDCWRDRNCNPDETVVYVGLDWSESHRLTRLLPRVAPWIYKAPMCEPPLLTKEAMIGLLKSEGIEPPRLYAMGFPHNNCGGFCCKAGQAHFALLLKTMPERYAHHEKQERELQEYIGTDETMLKDRRGGIRKPLSLTKLRERIEQQQTIDFEEWGGCGCAIE
jgi:hypothetical protein